MGPQLIEKRNVTVTVERERQDPMTNSFFTKIFRLTITSEEIYFLNSLSQRNLSFVSILLLSTVLLFFDTFSPPLTLRVHLAQLSHMLPRYLSGSVTVSFALCEYVRTLALNRRQLSHHQFCRDSAD